MAEERKRYQPRGKRKSKLPLVLVEIVVLVGIAGFVLLSNQPEKEPTVTADQKPGPPPEPEVEPLAAIIVGGPGEVRDSVSLPVSGTAVDARGASLHEIVAPRGEDGTQADAYWLNGSRYNYERLKIALLRVADSERDPIHQAHPSLAAVLIRADAGLRWREIQWLMQACAEPNVRIYKIHWAVKDTAGGDATLPMFLPLDKPLSLMEALDREFQLPEEIIEEGVIEEGIVDELVEEEPPGDLPEAAPSAGPPRVRITLKRRREESVSRVGLAGHDLGAENFDRLASLLEGVFESTPDLPCEIDASAEVPFADVVKAVDAARGVGFAEITFVGAPPPGPAYFGGEVWDPDEEEK